MSRGRGDAREEGKQPTGSSLCRARCPRPALSLAQIRQQHRQPSGLDNDCEQQRCLTAVPSVPRQDQAIGDPTHILGDL